MNEHDSLLEKWIYRAAQPGWWCNNFSRLQHSCTYSRQIYVCKGELKLHPVQRTCTRPKDVHQIGMLCIRSGEEENSDAFSAPLSGVWTIPFWISSSAAGNGFFLLHGEWFELVDY
jgi:hypothetical protein